MGLLSFLFPKKEQVDYRKLLEEGAVIVDVRTFQEYERGHIADSINIPLADIGGSAAFLGNRYPVLITCCRSGARSGLAKSILAGKGYTVYNGGAWDSLEKKIRKEDS